MYVIELAGQIACRLVPMVAVFAASALSTLTTASAQWVGGSWYDGWPGTDWRWPPVVREAVTVAVRPIYPPYYPNYVYPGYGHYPGAAYRFPGYDYPWYEDAYAAGYARGFDNGYGHGAGYVGGYTNRFPGSYPYPSY